MVTRAHNLESLHDINQYIYETLCNHCQLQVGAYPMTTRTLSRGGQPCGVYFCIHGPRATKFTAIWETEQNRILFYDCNGGRFLKAELDEASQLESAVA
jgi:hypothetical protein